MKHTYRLSTALLAAALVYFTFWQGGESFLSSELSGLLAAVSVFLISSLFLYLDTIIPDLNRERLLGLAIGITSGLISGYILQQLSMGLTNGNPGPFLILLYVLPTIFFGHVGLSIGWTSNNKDIAKSTKSKSINTNKQVRAKLLDTSVIIDGRIMDIAATKFVEGPFIVPNFVLREIQFISDSSDAIKRNRGRRGLDLLNKLQESKDINVKISYEDYANIRDVDSKLIQMSRETGAYLITNDFNLNKVAELQGVDVLNLNSLTNALKPIVLPGEDMEIDILREGKDEHQGIGYMEDGTMVVVENGRPLLGKKVQINVTSVIQTAAGKMIFTRVQNVIGDSSYESPEVQQTTSDNGRRSRGNRDHRDRRNNQRRR